nr:MAG TPA: DNA-directed RNA polymerase [Caudoviricetes sp.]
MSDSINAHKILQPGDRFGHWTVLGYIGLRKASSNARNRLRMYRCRCDCGRERDVRGTDLTRGVSPSCGCRRWEGRREIRDERFNAVTNRVPKPYVPEHPELFTDDWMFGDRQAPLPKWLAMKRYGYCGRTLPETEFTRDRSRKDGLDC